MALRIRKDTTPTINEPVVPTAIQTILIAEIVIQ
jgi:hypothetical protein